MTHKKILLAGVVFLLAVSLVLAGCGKKTTTTSNTNTSAQNVNTKTDEAPYTLVGNTKIFALLLVNGVFEYTKMTFLAGDTVKVTLTENGAPVDFEFVNPNVKSTNGQFVTGIQNNDQGGTYQLVCTGRECGTINVTVVPAATTNTNAAANTNASYGITKVELQRLPKGITFSPNVNMATTNSFSVGDNFGFGVTGTFATGAKLTFAILDSSGNIVEPQGMAFNLVNGTNGNCCFGLPNSAGSYNVKFYVNGTEGYSAPITVTE
ncbi:MAG: hypothetical protein WC528_01530 [Patescibacteria group bacterium]